jgi:peptidoglycan/LPS O-acetylase OafA/YrhL
MPEPVRSGQRYLPGLDGLRAIAVLAVVAYHIGLSWAPGGLLGVGVFFTLSGYIITDLLLGQQARTGSLQLVDFWFRRARRLLPALFVMLVVVVSWVALLDRSQLAALRGMVASAALYVSNWWLIAQHQSYFSRFGPPSSLGHLWSLAVEEQFYLVWPWLVLLGLRLYRGRRRASESYWGLAAGALILAAASAIEMALLYHPGYDPTRIYDGTDTRAFALLIGAALAFVWPSRKLRTSMSKASTWCLDAVGVVGLLVIAALIWRTTQYSAFLYQGGLVLLSVATALVVAAVAAPASRVGRVLGVGPLRWIGVRSYGIYLWHYPIIVLTTPANSTDSLGRGALQVAASIVVAALSWHFVEEPIRHGALERWWKGVRSGRAATVPGPAVRRRDWAGLAGGVGAVGVAGACLAGLMPAITPAPSSPAAGSLMTSTPRGATSIQNVKPTSAASNGGGHARGAGFEPRSTCRSVVHVGDSTSDGLNSPNYLPNPALRLSTQYANVGVRRVIWEISGGRSIVETLLGQANAATVAQRLIRHGYHGCWVLALGTNDTADVFVGSNVGVAQRIQRMMSVIGHQPVMWVNVISLLHSGPYSEHDMRQWDQALLRDCPRYPNMRVYDWSAVARRPWFISDGIHYTTPGYAARSHDIAQALARAFPAAPPVQLHQVTAEEEQDGSATSTPSCVVH